MCLPASIMFCADVLYLRVFTHVHYAPHSCVSPQQYLPPDMCLTNYKLTDGRGITINVMQSRILWRIWKCNCCVMGSQNGKEIQKVGSEEICGEKPSGLLLGGLDFMCRLFCCQILIIIIEQKIEE